MGLGVHLKLFHMHIQVRKWGEDVFAYPEGPWATGEVTGVTSPGVRRSPARQQELEGQDNEEKQKYTPKISYTVKKKFKNYSTPWNEAWDD